MPNSTERPSAVADFPDFSELENELRKDYSQMVADKSDVHSCDGSIDPVWLYLAPEERESFEAWEKLYKKENFHSCRMCRPTEPLELGQEFELKKPKKLTDCLPMNLDYIRPNSTERPSVTDFPDFSEENESRKDYSQMVVDESDVHSCDGSIDPVWLYLAPEERESFEAWEKLYKKENFHSCRMCRPIEPLELGQEFELKKPKKLTDCLPMNLDYIRPNSTERPSVTDFPDFSEENESRKDYSQMVADKSDVHYSCDGSIDPVWLYLAPEERESFEAWEKLYKKENFHSCCMCRPIEPLELEQEFELKKPKKLIDSLPMNLDYIRPNSTERPSVTDFSDFCEENKLRKDYSQMVADESDVHSCDGSIDPVWLYLAPEERESFEAWEKLYKKENFHSCRMCRPTEPLELGQEFELKKPKKLTDCLPMNLDYIRPNSTERPSATDFSDFSKEYESRKDYSQMVVDKSDVHYSCDGSIDPVWLYLAPEERESFEAWEKLYKKENFHSCRMCRPTEPFETWTEG